MTEVSDPFWYDSPSILWNSDRLIEFFVSSDQTDIEKLNSIMRFTIYTSIILSLYHSDPKFLVLSLIGASVTFFIKNGIEKKNNRKDFFDSGKEVGKKEFTQPNINNPFGNSSIVDIVDNPSRPPMIDYVSKDVKSMEAKQKVEDSFNYNLYKDLGDVWDKKHSQRQFYTMPDRGMIPPDSNGDFKNWLYGDMKSPGPIIIIFL